jgi:hypothetical protein
VRASVVAATLDVSWQMQFVTLGTAAMREAQIALQMRLSLLRSCSCRSRRGSPGTLTRPVLRRSEVQCTSDVRRKHAVARLVMETLQWDDDASQSSTQTAMRGSAPSSTSASRKPVRLRDRASRSGERSQCAWRTGHEPPPVRPVRGTSPPGGPEGSKEGSKEASTVAQTEPGKLLSFQLPNAPSSCWRSRGTPNGCGRSMERNTKNRRNTWHPLPPVVRNYTRFGPALQSSCCLQPDTLQDAEAGRYGAAIRRAALSGRNLKELADELEQPSSVRPRAVVCLAKAFGRGVSPPVRALAAQRISTDRSYP